MFPAERTHLILGGPGAGKTRALIEVIERELAAGVSPSEIAYVAFTTAAADEAKARAALRFSLDPRTDLPWFRTIHSLAYNALGITRDEVMGPRDWAAFGSRMGESISGPMPLDSVVPVVGRKPKGDVMVGLIDYAGTTLQTLEAARAETEMMVELPILKRFAASLENYKKQFGKVTFTDMLLMYPKIAVKPLPVTVAIIDEAQDLTPAQWVVVEQAFANATRVYMAGDDDQAIYRWAGADVNHFLALQGAQTILPHSHRLPGPIFDVGQTIVHRIKRRWPKEYTPAEHPGVVRRVFDMREARVGETPGSWMLLARNGYLLKRMREYCENEGLPYRDVSGTITPTPSHFNAIGAWEKMRAGGKVSATRAREVAVALEQPKPSLRETGLYGREDFPVWPWTLEWTAAFSGIPGRTRASCAAVLRRGESPDNPRIYLGTIHSVKGAEADHVMLARDVSARTMNHIHSDAEHRVFYVGATRAKQSLLLLRPQTIRSYQI